MSITYAFITNCLALTGYLFVLVCTIDILITVFSSKQLLKKLYRTILPTHYTIGNVLSSALFTIILCQVFTSFSLLLLCGDIEPNPGPTTNNHLSIIHLNVCSLRNKIPSLTAEISDDCDILCLTETRVDSDFTNEELRLPCLTGQMFRRDLTRTSGGICIQLSAQIVAKRLFELEQPNLELIWLKVTTNNTSFTLGVGYRNPALPVEYWSNLDENISRVVDSYGSQNIVLVGDFNEDLLNNSKHHLKDIIDSYNLKQIIDSPTRVTSHTSSLLDPIIIGSASTVDSSYVLTPFCSDHSPVQVNLSTTLPKYPPYKRRIYDYNQADWNLIELEFEDNDWPTIFNATDVDDCADILTIKLLNSVNANVPSKIVKFTHCDKPWVNAHIKSEIRKRNKLYQKAKKTKKETDWSTFKRFRNQVTSLIVKTKQSYLDSEAQKVDPVKQSEKSWWKLVKRVMNPNQKQSSIPSLSSGGKTIVNPLEKADLLNNHFADICTVADDHIPLEPDYQFDGEVLSTIEFTPDNVYTELNNLDTSKGPGPDNLSPIVLKRLAASLCYPVSILYQKEINECKHAILWKTSNVAPIPKPGDPCLPQNYRPISLLSILGKVMERIVFKQVYSHIAPYLTPLQSGFLPNHSTVTQLLEIQHLIFNSLDKKQEVLFCFCDISKAFDRVSHRALINKLKRFGIAGNLLCWFKDYLTKRKQRVCIDGISSSWRDILAGVPQGSILGPLLFLIFINDIVEDINCLIRLFADDTALILQSIDLNSDIHQLQSDLDRILGWAEYWSVKFNCEKTKAVLISRRNTPSNVNLTFNTAALSLVDEHKHLGITLNNNGTWGSHIEAIISKGNKRLGILRNLKYKITRDSQHIIYTTFIRSILEYADCVWDNIPDNLSIRLESINTNAIRCITGLTVSTPRRLLYLESGLLPLKKRRKFHRLVQLYKIIHQLSPDYLHSLLPPTAGERNPYAIRNPNHFSNYNCRTEAYRNSFFPLTTREYNELPEEIKSAESVLTFKSLLKKFIEFNVPKPPKWYSYGERKLNITLTQIRNNVSPLNLDLTNNHILHNPTCRECNLNRPEDAKHYFFECTKFNRNRESLQYVFNELEIECNIANITKGSLAHNYDQNKHLLDAVYKYIKDTKRFSL